MSDAHFKTAIVGAGGISRAHLRALRGLDHVEVVGVADVVPGKAREYAEVYGIAHAFESVEDLVALPGLDAVHVCTFNQAHRAPTVTALDAGLHVIVEKPMAARLDDATAMVEAARRNERLLMCAVKSRFSDDVMTAREICESGALGRIYYAETVAQRRRGIPGRTFISEATAGFGATADIGVYALDTALWLMGHPVPVSVSGITLTEIGFAGPPKRGVHWQWDPGRLDVEEFGAGWIRFDNGAVLVLKSVWAMHMESVGETFVLGTEGGLQLSPQLTLYKDTCGVLSDVKLRVEESPPQVQFFREIEAFYQAIAHDLPSPLDPWEALMTNVVIQGLLDSARQGGQEVPVRMPLPPTARLA